VAYKVSAVKTIEINISFNNTGQHNVIKMLSAKQYGERLSPPILFRRVIALCQEGRVMGAYKLPGRTGAWLIPENAPDPRNLKFRKNIPNDR